MPRHLVVVVLCGLVLAGCARSDLRLGADDTPGLRPGDDQPAAGPVVEDPDAVVELALADVSDYWRARYPDLYGDDFVELRGGLVPYGPDAPVPQCGSEPITYDDVAGNALYCPEQDFVAWDRVALIPELQAQYGSLTVGIVMAHEYAHAIQARGGVTGATVMLELQADCFAGAWVDDVRDRLATFSTDGKALDHAVGGFLELRDNIGVSARDPQAHGSGFDRVSAFQDGYERGAGACVGYEDDPPPVVAIPFGSASDARSGGNLPLDQLIDPLIADLESFYAGLFDDLGRSWDPVDEIVTFDPTSDTIRCGGRALAGRDLELAAFYCVPDDTIYMDGVGLVPALDDIGDFAFGGELARQYAFAAQAQLGIREDSVATALHADCLTGVYAAAQFLERIPGQQLVLSPGDLDEIIIAFLAFGGDSDATAFERTAAFRSGFVDGIEACDPPD